MRLPRRSRARATDENVVPLINIVFLLLVFFMLTGTLRPAEPFDVTPPKAVIDTVLDDRGLTVLIGPKGELALGSELIPLAQAEADVFMPVLNAIRKADFHTVILVTATEMAE